MRIVHVIDSLDPEQGGPSKVILSLATAQSARDHDVHVLGTRFSERSEAFLDAVALVPDHERLHLHPVDRAHARIDRIRSRAVVEVLRRLGRPDVVHLHGFWDITLLRAARWCRNGHIPHVITPHGMLDYWTLRQHSMKKKTAMRLGFGRMLRGASSIWALNSHEKEAIGTLGIARHIDVVPNGVFLEEIEESTTDGEFRRSVAGIGDDPFVLFLSRLHFKKGLDILARAWPDIHSALPDAHLVIAGPREDDSIDEFNRLIDASGLAARVHVVGPVYGARKVAAYRECSCFVLPSRQEGFSIAILEALALGAPCVISNECHFPEAEQAGAAIVVEVDPGEVARGVIRVSGDAALRGSLKDAGVRLVRDRYLWTEVARRSLDRYEEIIRREAGAGETDS